MNGLTKKEFIKRLDRALERVHADISGHASGGRVASGLSSEGFAGGYAEALRDVDALLRHGYPSDSRGYWKG
jgi:predicted alpha/beta-hydrolase family hydrolase